MENTIVTLFVALAFVLGMISGAVITPNDTETVIVYEDKIVESIVEVPVEVVVNAPNQLELAVAEFMNAVDEEEDEAGNSVDVLGTYDFDEVEISRVYDDWSVAFNNDKTTVDFRVKLRFDEDGEASEKETYDVTVIFEEDEDTEVEAVLV